MGLPAEQSNQDLETLKNEIVRIGRSLGFEQVAVSDIELGTAEARLREWLEAGCHGSMEWMARHGSKRSRPAELVPGTLRVISVSMDYLPGLQEDARALLDHESKAYVSRYALGRDYHKVLRGRLRRLARDVENRIGTFGYRVFVDSAPVLEKPLAEKAGLGWIGKHTNLINRNRGSWFFLGEIYTDLPLPVDEPASDHCGSCRACIDVCPTGAITAPYRLDARRCISYLTIEHDGAIPEAYRKPMGNRIYGCDDCQLFCPWNKFAVPTDEGDFAPRHGLADADLAELMRWSETEWLEKTEGSAIRRIGYERWQRNVAVALGNAETTDDVLAALEEKRGSASKLVAEHVEWSLAQHRRNR